MSPPWGGLPLSLPRPECCPVVFPTPVFVGHNTPWFSASSPRVLPPRFSPTAGKIPFVACGHTSAPRAPQMWPPPLGPDPKAPATCWRLNRGKMAGTPNPKALRFPRVPLGRKPTARVCPPTRNPGPCKGPPRGPASHKDKEPQQPGPCPPPPHQPLLLSPRS